jgi:hypothetical protein
MCGVRSTITTQQQDIVTRSKSCYNIYLNLAQNGSNFKYFKPKRQAAIREIRRLIIAGQDHAQIQAKLGLATRSYFRYVSEAFKEDRQKLSETTNPEEVMTQVAIATNRFTELYRISLDIAKNKGHEPLDRLEALKLYGEIAAALAVIYRDGPTAIARELQKNNNTLPPFSPISHNKR